MKVSTSTIRRSGCSRNGEATLRSDQRVGLVEQRREVAVQQPGLLNELELPGDIGIEANEEQPALLRCRRCRGSVDRRPVLAAAPQDAVIVRGVEQGLRRAPRPSPGRRADWRGARASPAGSRGRADRFGRSRSRSAAACTRPAGSSPLRAQQVAVDVAADDPLGEPVGGDVRRGSGSCARIFAASSSSEFQNARDILPKLAHDHVAAVETEVEEALRARLLASARRCAPTRSSRHDRSGRLLVMGVGMSEQDLAERDAVPLDRAVPAGRRSGRRCRPCRLRITEGNRLRQAVGEAEMLPADADSRRAAGQARAGGRSSRREARALVRPPSAQAPNAADVLAVEQQQRMHRQWRRHLALVRQRRPSSPLDRLVAHGNVAAPQRSALDDGRLPLVLRSCRQGGGAGLPGTCPRETAPKRSRAHPAKARLLQAGPGERDGGGARRRFRRCR